MIVAGAILAAGSSARLGRPKALLPCRGTTLLRHAAEALVASACVHRLVVFPPRCEPLAAELAGLPLRSLVNREAATGMASSIRAAVAALAELSPAADAILLVLVDQPTVDGALLDRVMAAAAATGLAACTYEGAIGPPACFGRDWFDDLGALSGDRGARALLEAHRERVALVEFPGGAFDVDREADYVRLASGS